MVIRWTRQAQESLRQVYDFYLPTTGKEKAGEIVWEIILYVKSFKPKRGGHAA